jgi:hypothetical protein
MATTSGLLAVVSAVPNADDVSFFHRALVQLRYLDQPFRLVDTLHDARAVPPLSILHYLTAYEPFVAMAARSLGLDPLWTYQSAGAFAAAALLSITLVLLAMELGASPPLAMATAAAALAFLAIDGNLQRTFGSMAFPRFWQGKCILWSTLLPATLLVTYRFLREPTARHFIIVLLAGVCAVGLSGSGTVLFPGLVLCASIAYVIARGPGDRRAATAALVNLASVYPLGIGFAFAVGVLPKPDMTTWSQWEPVWWRNLYGYVIGDAKTLVRDFVLLLLVPALALRPPHRRFLLLFSFVVAAVFLNPISGPRVLRIVTPANYWRFAYLLPLPLCAGLVVTCVVPPGSLARRASGAAALLTIAWAFESPALLQSPHPTLTGYKLPPSELTFASIALPHLRPGDRVLAPEQVVSTFALLDPTLRFVAGRSIETPGLFRTAGRAEEGARRVGAQRIVSQGTVTDEGQAGLRDAVGRRLRAVVTLPSLEPVVVPLLQDAGGQWTVAARDTTYTLFLRTADDGRGPR